MATPKKTKITERKKERKKGGYAGDTDQSIIKNAV
jgi:hypothetical protein